MGEALTPAAVVLAPLGHWRHAALSPANRGATDLAYRVVEWPFGPRTDPGVRNYRTGLPFWVRRADLRPAVFSRAPLQVNWLCVCPCIASDSLGQFPSLLTLTAFDGSGTAMSGCPSPPLQCCCCFFHVILRYYETVHFPACTTAGPLTGLQPSTAHLSVDTGPCILQRARMQGPGTAGSGYTSRLRCIQCCFLPYARVRRRSELFRPFRGSPLHFRQRLNMTLPSYPHDSGPMWSQTFIVDFHSNSLPFYSESLARRNPRVSWR